MKRISIFSLFIFFTVSQLAQQSIRFDNIELEEGLSQSTVYSIVQDFRGFVWIATTDGLNRYDGYNFRIYKSDPENENALRNNYIHEIYEDRQNRLWVGTHEGGLSVFNREQDNFINIMGDKNNPGSFLPGTVYAIYQSHDDTLWFATNKGVYKLVDFKGKESAFYNYIPDKNIRSIFENDDGSMWFGTASNGISVFNRKTSKFTNIRNNPSDSSSLTEGMVGAIMRDSYGILWVGTEDGLNRYDDENGSFIRYQHNPANLSSINNNIIPIIFEDSQRNLWIGTEYGGLNLYNRKQDSFIYFKSNSEKATSLIHNSVLDICEDSAGILWIGTMGGISKYDLNRLKFEHYEHIPRNSNSLSHNWIWAIREDKNKNLWVGTQDGLTKLNRTKNEYTIYSHIPGNENGLAHKTVKCILIENDQLIWIGTYDGLNKLNPETGKFTTYKHKENDPTSLVNDDVRAIYRDSQGVLWIGTDDGLSMFDDKEETFRSYKSDASNERSLSVNGVWQIFEDAQKRLWLGTFGGGLNQFHRETRDFTSYMSNPNDKNSISNNTIKCITQDKNNVLWVGTVDGLNRFDPGKNEFKVYREKDGLPNNVIYDIIYDKNNDLWMSTNHGLSKMDIETETFTNYSEQDGLQSDEFNGGAYFQSESGELFFGGIKGFNAFYPDSLFVNEYQPQIVITNFLVLNKPVIPSEDDKGRIILEKVISETKSIDLLYTDYTISFEFSVLHFSAPGNNLYAYKLENFDEEWVYTNSKKRFATYTNLPAGEYTFKVKGTNSDGVWSGHIAEVQLIIHPPFWKTWWFRSLILLFMGGSAYLWYRNKISTMKKQKEMLERQVLERTAEILEKNIKLEKLSIVASETDNAVIIMDEKFNFEWINEGFTKLYGFTFDDYVLEHGSNLIEVSKSERIEELTNRCIELKKSVQYESKIVTKDNEGLWVQTTLTPIFDDAGNIKKIIAIDSDISELKEAEMVIKAYNEEILTQNEELAVQHEAIERQNKELENHRNHLEKLVDEKTKELKAALYKAEESDRLKTAFLTNMSHEIRTPMNAIIGFSEILMKTNTDEVQKEYLSSIKLSGRTLLSLINDILDLSRIEAGKMTLRKDFINIKNMFFELEHIFGMEAELKGLNLITEISENVPEFIELDELRTRQILINLINNAIKFTYEGFIKMKADVKSNKKNINLILSVQDTGIGIKKNEQEKIFEAFNQSGLNDARNYEGTGLGLAIVSKIVALFYGNIKIESELGKGTTFIVELPKVKIHLKKQVGLPKEIINPDYITFKGGTILIVDDKDFNIKVIKGLLNQHNLTLIEAYNGIEAIDMAKNTLPDLILMDLKMPKMNGYKATKILKSHKKTRNIPVVVLTASVLGFNENLLEEYEFSGYLPKPIEVDRLVIEVSKFLPYKVVVDASSTYSDSRCTGLFKDNPQLKKYLEKNVLNIWEQLQITRTSILEKEFASQIIKAGQEFNNDYLIEKGKSLELALKTFNIEKIKSILNEFVIVFDNLK